MINNIGVHEVYIACGNTDIRKSINGLATLVKESFLLNPFSSCLFVFCNRNRDKIKILHWVHNGFWLYYRRLEKGKFQWPDNKNNVNTLQIGTRQLNWLLDGLSLEQKQAHKKLIVDIII